MTPSMKTHKSNFTTYISDLAEKRSTPEPFHQKSIIGRASQCGYVVSTSAFRQGVPGSNPIAAWKSCEVYPGLGILQPQWNPYPTLPHFPAECVTSISMVWQSVTTHGEVAGNLSSRT